MKCLKKDRADRPQTMDDIAEALDACLHPRRELPDPHSPSSLSSPGLPERSRRVLTSMALIAAAAVMLIGGSALVLSRRPASTESARFEVQESEILQAISAFHPGKARELATRLREESEGSAFEARASRLAEEATWVARLQNRLADRLAAAPIEVSSLRFRPTGGITAVRIVGVDGAGLRMVQDGRTQDLRWERLEPAQLIELLEAALGAPEDVDLLALGILALRTGLPNEASRCFRRLRTTPLGPIAERYQPTTRN